MTSSGRLMNAGTSVTGSLNRAVASPQAGTGNADTQRPAAGSRVQGLGFGGTQPCSRIQGPGLRIQGTGHTHLQQGPGLRIMGTGHTDLQQGSRGRGLLCPPHY